MAHIFKHPSTSNKGIIIFTHKEIKFFSKGFKKTRFGFFNSIVDRIYKNKDYKKYFKSKLTKLSENYFLGIHYGWEHSNETAYPLIDFYMAGEGTVTFAKNHDVFSIPLCSRNFMSKNFQPADNKKFWDIVCVSRAANFKNLDKLLHAVKKIYESGQNYKVLLIVPPSHSEKNVYVNLMADYMSMFDTKEKQLFTIIKLSKEMSFLGMPQDSLIHFYQSSKVFTLFSRLEGESRVISEALLCGLKVVAFKGLRGGGLDYLNQGNSFLFDSYETAETTLISAVKDFDQGNRAKLTDNQEELKEVNSLHKIKSAFKKLYKEHDLEFDEVLTNTNRLDLRLPGHYHDVSWSRGINTTADILTEAQFDKFYDTVKL